jgi:hypothetical protein
MYHSSTMEYTDVETLIGLRGQYCRMASGARVFVQSLPIPDAGMPARAKVQLIDGPQAGQVGGVFVEDIAEVLGLEIQVTDG